MTNDRLQQAISAAKEGNRKDARHLLLELIRDNPNHERAWLWLSRVVEEPEAKIRALEFALRINPENKKAQKYLANLKATSNYKAAKPVASLPKQKNSATIQSELEKEITHLRTLSISAPTSTERIAAQRKMSALKRQLELLEPLKIHTTIHWLRLSSGLPILYFFLALMHAGLRPWQLNILLWLAVIPVSVGSLLLVALFTTHEHPSWMRWMEKELTDIRIKLYLHLAAFFLALMPFFILLIDSLKRLFQLTIIN